MFALKVACLLAFTAVASAQNDAAQSRALVNCVQHALTVGVPELGIAKFDPEYHLQRNLTWQGEIAGITSTLTFHDLILIGFPSWEVSINQTSLDTDSTANLNFEYVWKRLQVNGSVTLRESIWKYGIEQHGSVLFDFRNTNWIGNAVVTRGNDVSPRVLDVLNVDWHVEELVTYITGLGVLNRPIGQGLTTGISLALNKNAIGNLVGDSLREYLNPNWYENGKTSELVKWCNANPAQ